MFLKNLSLVNYKNFEAQQFDFDSKTNCFVGDNGKGKTNVLDAIYHLAFGKSYFNPLAGQNIRHGEEFFIIKGTFELNDRNEKIVCSLKKGMKKIIKRNNKVYDRLSDHIGLLPLVIISPADRDLILEGSDIRRKFMDSVISQSDKEYLQTLLKYNKILQQRNTLLKYFAVNHSFDQATISVYNDQLNGFGIRIFEKRAAFIQDFIPIFKEQYLAISGGHELVNVHYESKLFTQNLLSLLESNIEKDRALQYTSTGIHKDDLRFEIEDYPIKKFGSQGTAKIIFNRFKVCSVSLSKGTCRNNPHNAFG